MTQTVNMNVLFSPAGLASQVLYVLTSFNDSNIPVPKFAFMLLVVLELAVGGGGYSTSPRVKVWVKNTLGGPGLIVSIFRR